MLRFFEIKYQKAIPALILFFCFMFVSLSNASAKVHTMYEFSKKYLPLNERTDYSIVSLSENKSGKCMFAIKKITQLDMDMLLVRYEGTEGEKKENWEVKLVMKDLSPFSFEFTLTEGDKTRNYTGIVSGREITLNERASGQDPREVILSKSGNFYISTMLPFLLRNLEYETGDWYTFNLLQVDLGKFITPIVQVKEKEVLEVPAGMYECYKVTIKIGNEQHIAWYSIKEPHYLVKYKYPDKEFVMQKHY
jgi:hypothetical protein